MREPTKIASRERFIFIYMCIYKEHGGNSINIVRSGGWRFLQHDENALPVAGFHRLPSI